MTKKSVFLFCSHADFGTRSISDSYQNLINPEEILEYKQGFRKMRLRGWLKGFLFSRKQKSGTLICLFNAPILVAAIFRKRGLTRVVGILDWTESFPSQRRSCFTIFYDKFYIWAFSRMDAVYSPSQGFRDYYNHLGANISPCIYPLPKIIPEKFRAGNLSPVKLLFVGADYRRKGGDILLNAWKQISPTNATLTFVCPSPPDEIIPGVYYLRDIKAGTLEQILLFQEHDIFVLPTILEPFGFALLEAVNSGMCAVTTEAAGAAQIVRDSGGIVTDTAMSACKAAINLSQSPAEIHERRKNCINFLPQYEQRAKKSLDSIVQP